VISYACSNCCFNSLQYGSFGLSAGYCVEHRVVLRRADETTCGRHLRKDLLLESAEAMNQVHSTLFDGSVVRFLRTKASAMNGAQAVDESTALLETDTIGEAVSDYGMLDSKNESLARLRSIPGPRAELAVLSLGRTYVRRCKQRGGPWTSGLGLLWWARKRLDEQPGVSMSDLRRQSATSLDRQAELVAWSLVMLRLTFIADVGWLAPIEDDVSGLSSIAEKAAEASDTPDLAVLLDWIRADGLTYFDRCLPKQRVKALRAELHREADE
jgi:hypothetical protein